MQQRIHPAVAQRLSVEAHHRIEEVALPVGPTRRNRRYFDLHHAAVIPLAGPQLIPLNRRTALEEYVRYSDMAIRTLDRAPGSTRRTLQNQITTTSDGLHVKPKTSGG